MGCFAVAKKKKGAFFFFFFFNTPQDAIGLIGILYLFCGPCVLCTFVHEGSLLRWTD